MRKILSSFNFKQLYSLGDNYFQIFKENSFLCIQILEFDYSVFMSMSMHAEHLFHTVTVIFKINP